MANYVTLLTCAGCQADLPENNFYRDRSRQRGRGYRCKRCLRPIIQRRRRRRQYGLGQDDFERLRQAQGNVCAICFSPFRPEKHRTEPFVDHDHSTGQVRGLLCARCNSGLGHFKDDIERLRGAIRYLEMAA